MTFISRISLFLVLLCCAAIGSYGQGLLDKVVTIEARKKPLSEVLKAIGKQGNFSFSYNSNIIRKDSLVTITARNKPVRQVLQQLLGENCQYKETDKYIIIQQAEREKWYVVSGIVTDAQTGLGLPDVSVFERQQLASVLTDASGHYKLLLRDRERYAAAEITISKGFYIDTNVTLIKGYDQQLDLAIMPEDHTLPDMVITQFSSVERSWFGRFLVSSRLRTQSANLGKFFVNKPFQVSVIPGVGTHGKMAGQVTNKASLNVLGGYTAGVNGFELAGLFNIDKKDVRYAQAAGVFNVVAGNVDGAQVSGVSNYIRGKVSGAQATGIINKAAKVDGVQVSGFANMAFDTVRGVQVSGFFNAAKSANVQTAGFINMSKEVKGAQTAGFINMASGVEGGQTAGFINMAEDVHGFQLAGFINLAQKVKGIQLAGFINIADSNDHPIGLVNIIGNGDRAIGMTIDETGATVVGFRSGGRITYGLIGLGRGELNGTTMFGLEAGLGIHIPVSRHFRINNELTSMSMSDFNKAQYFNNSLRILPALKVGPIELFAGPCLNYAVYGDELGEVVVSKSLWRTSVSAHTHELSIGYKAGVQLHIE